MPEGDTIFRAARALRQALAGDVVMHFESMLPKLDRVHYDTPLTGRTIIDVRARGKWMLMEFSGDLFLLTHMLMNGTWHIYRPGEKWRRPRDDMRIVLGTGKFVAVGFRVPVAEFHTAASLARHRGFRSIEHDLLSPEFDAAQAQSALASRPEMEVGVALLRQSLVAGAGNVFKSEVCFVCGVNPFRRVSSLTSQELTCLIERARELLAANVTDESGDRIITYTGMRRTTGRANPDERLWVYGRRGKPCRRCGTHIESRKQGEDARVTFWCPQCQAME